MRSCQHRLRDRYQIILMTCWGIALIYSSHTYALIGGQVDLENHYPAVLSWSPEGQKLLDGHCTASKVGPTTLLTAAHCVLKQNKIKPDLDLGPWVVTEAMGAGHAFPYSFQRVLEENQPEQTLKIRTISFPPEVLECLAHPDKDPVACQNRTPVVDLAVIEIEADRESFFHTAPTLTLDLNEVAAKRRVILMGYGAEADQRRNPPRLKFGYADTSANAEVLEALKNTEAETHGFPDLTLFFGVLTDHSTGTGVSLGGGDSGGPILDAKSGKIIGVNADGFCPLSHLGCEVTHNSTFARLSNSATAATATWLSQVLHLDR